MDLGATVEADDQPLEVVKVSEGRSTTQRTRPSPEPCSVLRRAITGLTPRARTRRRCASWSSATTASGRQRGLPTAPRPGGTLSRGGMSWVTSLRLPPVAVQIPVASTRRRCFDPFLALSTGLGPVSEPPFSLAHGSSRRRRAPTRARPPPAARRAGAGAASPNPGPLPLFKAPVAGRARAEAELERQMPPGDPCVQDEQNPLQRLPVRKALATRKAEAPLHLRQ
jgi:hypothetical protein